MQHTLKTFKMDVVTSAALNVMLPSASMSAYAYAGAQVINNICEIAALRGGLAYARTHFRNSATHLEIIGDSNLFIEAKRGFSKIRAPHLAGLDAQIDYIASHLAWTSWTHTKRTNKMADRLANMAMDSRAAKAPTDHATGSDKANYLRVLELKDNDMQLSLSPWRHPHYYK